MKTLKDVKVGETVTVAKLHGEGPVKRRIMDMGITKGARQMLAHIVLAGDFADGCGFPCLCHCQRHHSFASSCNVVSKT